MDNIQAFEKYRTHLTQEPNMGLLKCNICDKIVVSGNELSILDTKEYLGSKIRGHFETEHETI